MQPFACITIDVNPYTLAIYEKSERVEVIFSECYKVTEICIMTQINRLIGLAEGISVGMTIREVINLIELHNLINGNN